MSDSVLDERLKQAAGNLMQVIRREFPEQTEAWRRDRFWGVIDRRVDGATLTLEEMRLIMSAIDEPVRKA